MYGALLKVCSVMPETSLWARTALAARSAKKPAKDGVMATKVRKGHAFDATKLLGYLRAELGSGVLPASDGDIQIRQFSWGQSNPTFALRWGVDASEGLVVRKQPPGKLLKGAHDVGREYAAMTALRDTDVPVPNARLFCEDTDVLGTKFFAYDFVPGRFFSDQYLTGIKDVSERRAIYEEYASTAAKLHSVSPKDTPGLETLGKGGGYLARQVKTWSAQYRKSIEAAPDLPNPSMERLVDYLPGQAQRPEVDEGSDGARVCHGDFRLDNMIFHPTEPRVVAVLDWELATIGHPLADVAYTAMPYFLPPLPSGPLSGFAGLRDLNGRHGLPTLEQHRASYASAAASYASAAAAAASYASAAAAAASSGTPQEVLPPGRLSHDLADDALEAAQASHDTIARAEPHWLLFCSVAYFRVAAICQGVYARSKAGQASAANAGAIGALATSTADIAWSLAQQHAASAPPL